MSRERILRWPEGEPRPEKAFQQIGITQVVNEPPAGAITGVLWPGIAREPTVEGRGDETASASREPWVNANGYRVQYERALGRPGAVLAPTPPDRPDRPTPFETVEMGLVEARINGGNCVLAPDARYRESLRTGDAKALAAWESLGATAAWLDRQEALFAHPVVPSITMLVDDGRATAELANLGYRRGGTPRLVPAAAIPKPSPDILVLVAASLKQPPPAAVWEHARAGAFVVIDTAPDSAWKVHKKNPDRTFYSLGDGFVVAYHKRITDPSEFALDVLDLVTHRRRAARLWNALAAIPLAVSPGRGRLLLHVVNYGSPIDADVQARVHGHFPRALLHAPGLEKPSVLKVSKRGTMSEVFLPELNRVATIEFLR